MLKVENLNLTLGNKHVLQDINLSIPIQGEIIGIMGPNGAGKSSLIKSLIGEFRPTGSAQLNDHSIQNNLKHVTYIPQKAHIDLDFPINVEHVVLSGAYKDIGWFRWVTPTTAFKSINANFGIRRLAPPSNFRIKWRSITTCTSSTCFNV